MTHELVVNSDSPVPIVLLIDGSDSMRDLRSGTPFSKTQIMTGMVNDFIGDLNRRCHKVLGESQLLSVRYVLSIIVYGDRDNSKNICTEKYGNPWLTCNELKPSTSRSIERVTLQKDGEDYRYLGLELATWFTEEDLFIGGGTPMFLGFQKAAEALLLLRDSVPRCNLDSSPFPLVFNITDGQPNQYPSEFEAITDIQAGQNAAIAMMEEVNGVEFNPGPNSFIPVIFNIYLSDNEAGQPIIFPDSNNVPEFLQNDDLGLWLYNSSDPMPMDMLQNLDHKKELMGLGEHSLNRKCFIWDAHPNVILELLQFLSTIPMIQGGDDERRA